MTIRQGEHLALVGATGAGKSTLAKLLTRQYDPLSGSVRFGGIDLRDATSASLRERIVFLPQEGHLFAGSIADNVRLARPDASGRGGRGGARADRCARAFQRGFRTASTPTSRRAALRLSSGERQLIALARAALVEPARDRAGRGDVVARPRNGARRRARDRGGLGEPHRDHDRAPPVDGGTCRSRGAARARSARRARVARRTRRAGRPLRGALGVVAGGTGDRSGRATIRVEHAEDEREDEPARRAGRPQDEPRGERV